jgi:aldehyde dehydrogenase (NAD+)
MRRASAATGKFLTKASVGTATDIDEAVKAARNAFKTTWGLNCPGNRRGQLLQNLATLLEKHQDEVVALDSLNAGGPSPMHTLYIC